MTEPVSLTRVVWCQRVLALLGLLTVVLTVVMRDALVRAWAEDHRSLGDVLRTGGLEAVRDSDITPPAFVPVAAVLFVVIVSLLWVLTLFVRLGYGWARPAITALLVFLAVASVAGLRTNPPALFAALAVLSFVVEGAFLSQLWHRDTTAYLRERHRAAALHAGT